jgi:hypothetical protein
MTDTQPTQTPVQQRIQALIMRGKEQQKVEKLKAVLEAKLNAN